MRKPPMRLQDLRRRLYVKAKAEPSWRCWGLYVHLCKRETLWAAYRLAKDNDGAPGSDGVTFEASAAAGVEAFLPRLREELEQRTYRPLPLRKVGIPKEGGTRHLSMPAIRDRVVQGAIKLILEPIFAADFQSGSYGYRPKRSPHEAVQRVAEAILAGKTYVMDLDLTAYVDNVRHHTVLAKAAQRIQDRAVLHLLKLLLQAAGKRGVPQGGVHSPLLSNLYLNAVDQMLERAKARTKVGQRTAVEYARCADDLVVLIGPHPRQPWLREAVAKRLREELALLQGTVNATKRRMVDLTKGDSFGFLGFDFRRIRSRAGRWMPLRLPQGKKRTALLQRLKAVFQRLQSQPISQVIEAINPILRGWVHYFAFGHASRCFAYVRRWVEKKIRRHLARACKRRGFGWKRWSSRWLYDTLGLFKDYHVTYRPSGKAAPV